MNKIVRILSLGICFCAAACSNPSNQDFTDNVVPLFPQSR